MPVSSLAKRDVLALKTHYEGLGWFKKLFFPNVLGKALKAYSVDQADDIAVQHVQTICHAFVFSSNRLQRWLFSCLTSFGFSLLMIAYKQLCPTVKDKIQGPPPEPYVEAIIQDEIPEARAAAIIHFRISPDNEQRLRDASPEGANVVFRQQHTWLSLEDVEEGFNEATQDIIAAHPLPIFLADAFTLLHTVHMFNAANRNILATSLTPEYLLRSLTVLQRIGQLTDENRKACGQHPNQQALSKILRRLEFISRSKGFPHIAIVLPYILNPLPGHIPINYHNMTDRLNLIQHFNEIGLFTSENEFTTLCTVLFKHPNAFFTAKALQTLELEKCLTPELSFVYLQGIARSQWPMSLALALLRFHQSDCPFGEEGRQAILYHLFPFDLANALAIERYRLGDRTIETLTTLKNSEFPMDLLLEINHRDLPYHANETPLDAFQFYNLTDNEWRRQAEESLQTILVPESMQGAMSLLRNASLLQRTYGIEYKIGVSSALSMLSEKAALTRKNLHFILQDQERPTDREYDNVFNRNFKYIPSRGEPLDLANAILSSYQDQLQPYREMIWNHRRPREFANELMEFVQLKGDLLKGNQGAIISDTLFAVSDCRTVGHIIRLLYQCTLLTDELREAHCHFLKTTDENQLEEIDKLLVMVQRTGVLDTPLGPHYFQVIFHDERYHSYMMQNVFQFFEAGPLKRSDKTLHHVHLIMEKKYEPTELNRLLSLMRDARILNEDRFCLLMRYAHSLLLPIETRDDEVRYYHCDWRWERLPVHMLTAAVFDHLINLCIEHQADVYPSRARPIIVAYVQRLIDIAPEEEHRPRLDADTQSTHIASVHATVSSSAIRLKALYASQMDGHLAEIFQEIKTWLFARPNWFMRPFKDSLHPQPSYQVQAAQRAFNRLTEEFDSHIDPSSTVSTKQLLAFFWLAVHDHDRRMPEFTLETAKSALIDALYEVQREYNIDASGQDNRQRDSSSCPPGAFNKFMEKLQGISPVVKIEIVTHGIAMLKFPRVAKAEAIAYLSHHFDALSEEEKNTVRANYQENQSIDVASIWPKIVSLIEEKMWSEFGVSYQNNRGHHLFVSLITHGHSGVEEITPNIDLPPNSPCCNFLNTVNNESSKPIVSSEQVVDVVPSMNPYPFFLAVESKTDDSATFTAGPFNRLNG